MGTEVTKRTLTQCDKIVAYMQEMGSITQLDALREFGCMRLASRISDLKKRKYDIVSVREESVNRYGDKIHYHRYSFADKEVKEVE